MNFLKQSFYTEYASRRHKEKVSILYGVMHSFEGKVLNIHIIDKQVFNGRV